MSIEIVLDTETTGLDPEDGHRIVEIGCIELENHLPTGKHLQLYINPEREVPPEATAVHGITDDFLKNKPTFSQVYSEFIEFIGDAKLVIHNAEFDMKFLNWELKNVGHDVLPWNRAIDTLQMARQKFPGSPANLDALCRRFGIDSSEREYHGALLDSELLADVYMELLGGRQHGMTLSAQNNDKENPELNPGKFKSTRSVRKPRLHSASEKELIAHEELLKEISSSV